MNTEHTNQPRQAANAAFEQWWQRHGLEDPMDDEDRQYATASSWARRGYLAAMQAQQAEPVAYGKTPGCKQCEEAEACGLTFCPECDAQFCEGHDSAEEGAAQPPAVAVPAEWRSPSNTPIVALGDALHCWLAVKSKHDSKVRVYDAYYCNFPLMQDEAGDFPDWTLHDEIGEEVAMVGWAEKVAHPDFNDFYSALGDIELIGWQPVNPPAAPTAAQKGGAV